jgi:hypothetical protein
MKNILFIIVFLGIFSGGYLLYDKSTSPNNIEGDLVAVDLETTNVANLEFTYKKSPKGYVLINNHVEWPENIIKSISLFNKQDYEWFSKPDFLGEGPPSINISVFSNSDKLSPLEWSQANALASNIELVFEEPIVSRLADVEGVSYIVNGLFIFSTYVLSYNEQIYLLSGAYYEEGDVYQKDFEELLSTIKFK